MKYQYSHHATSWRTDDGLIVLTAGVQRKDPISVMVTKPGARQILYDQNLFISSIAPQERRSYIQAAAAALHANGFACSTQLTYVIEWVTEETAGGRWRLVNTRQKTPTMHNMFGVDGWVIKQHHDHVDFYRCPSISFNSRGFRTRDAAVDWAVGMMCPVGYGNDLNW